MMSSQLAMIANCDDKKLAVNGMALMAAVAYCAAAAASMFQILLYIFRIIISTYYISSASLQRIKDILENLQQMISRNSQP